MVEKSLKIGQPIKDEENGWFITTDDGEMIYLKDGRQKYIDTYKEYNDVRIITKFSQQAQKLMRKKKK